MVKPKINESDLCRAAKRLRTSTAEVETVAEVESADNAFYSDGFPVILFERHKFHKFTGGKFAKEHPRISDKVGGGYSPPKGLKNEDWQRAKFAEAFALDPEAAMKSCSWGKFQLMGFNYEVCGFDSVGEFVDAMKESEGRQLDAFVEFVIHSGLGDELRGHDWKGFARGYNGAGYRQNAYDQKLEKAFEKFSKRKIYCGPISAASSDNQKTSRDLLSSATPSANEPPIVSEQPVETKVTESTETGDKTVTASVTTPAGDPPDASPVHVTTGRGVTHVLAWFGGPAAIVTGVWGFMTGNASALATGMVCLTVIILAVIFRKAILDALRMHIASDPNRKNVT